MGRKSDLNTMEKITNQLEKADGAVGQLMEIDKQMDKQSDGDSIAYSKLHASYQVDERAKLCQTADKHYEKAGEPGRPYIN
jgi:hypothetical protein